MGILSDRQKNGKKFLRGFRSGEEFAGYIDSDEVVCVEGPFWGDCSETGARFAISELSVWLPPVCPSKIMAIGRNFKEHAVELNHDIPTTPITFMKSPTSLTGHNTDIIYPTGLSNHVDYESELTVVMGREAYKVSESSALDYVFGFTCGNDVSARDVQRRDGQWTLAKSFNTFTPLGPWIATGLSPLDLAVSSRLNGELRQNSRTSNMIFPVAMLISFISQVVPLLPGDIIMTGTPAGVGQMKDGDVVEVEIEGVGVLKNTMRGSAA